MYKVAIYNHKMKDEVAKFILSILEGEFNHVNIERPDLQNIPSVFQINNGNFWVAVDGDKIIGTLGLIDRSRYWYGICKKNVCRCILSRKRCGSGSNVYVSQFCYSHEL